MRPELPCISVFTSKAENFRKSPTLGGWQALAACAPGQPRACGARQPTQFGKCQGVGDTQGHTRAAASPSLSVCRPAGVLLLAFGTSANDAEILARAETRS